MILSYTLLTSAFLLLASCFLRLVYVATLGEARGMKYLGAGGGAMGGVGVEDWGRGTERRGGGAMSTATQNQEIKRRV